jgi:hypothetical protein
MKAHGYWLVLLVAVGASLGVWLLGSSASAPEPGEVGPARSDENRAEGASVSGGRRSTPPSAPPLDNTTELDRRQRVEAARSASASTQTIEGHLAEFIGKQFDDLKPHPITPSSTDMAVRDPDLNPEGKVLDVQQTERLAAVIFKFSKRDEGFAREETRLSRAALLASVDKGQFVARKQPPMVPTDAQSMADMKAAIAKQWQDNQETVAELTRWLGKPTVDWGYSQLASLADDRVGYSTIVYYTVAQQPELFESRRLRRVSDRERKAAVREFFAAIPK